MTPDEIRVAIRLLGQIVVYNDRYPVEYNGFHYVVKFPYDHRVLFGKDGDFSKSWIGFKVFGPQSFKVVDRLPDPPKRRRRTVAKK